MRLTRHRQEVRHPTAEVVDADLRLLADCLRVCEDVDLLIHAAGGVGSAAVGAESAMDGIVSNLVLTAQVLQAAWTQRVRRVLIYGSTTGYPESQTNIREEDMEKGPPPPQYWGYGWMRRYLEHLGEYVSQQSATEVVALRPAAVYGPGDRSSHVIPSLLAKAAVRQDPYEVWGSGAEERDFLYIDDLARASYLALEKLVAGRAAHLGSGETVTIARLTELVLEASGHQPHKVTYLLEKPTNIHSRRFDLTRAEQELGFRARVPLREGLRLTWESRQTESQGS